MGRVNFWIDSRGRYHDAQTLRYIQTPQCSNRGELLIGAEAVVVMPRIVRAGFFPFFSFFPSPHTEPKAVE